MIAQPVFMSGAEAPTLPKRAADEPVGGEANFTSEHLLNGRREILISHGDRVYRLRHTSNDKLILTK